MGFGEMFAATRRLGRLLLLGAGCSLMAPPAIYAADAGTGALRLDPPLLPLSCLNSVRPGSLVYPPQTPGTQSGVVRVEMEFAAADAPPSPTLRFSSGDPAFARAVLDHIAGYRLPCLQAGRSVTTVQEFQFVGAKPADSQVMVSESRYSDDNYLLKNGCTVEPMLPPAWPKAPGGLRLLLPETVVLRLIFTATDLPPEVTVLFDGGQAPFVDSVLAVVRPYRLRCTEPVDWPVTSKQVFQFVNDDSQEPPRPKTSLSLQQLIGAIDHLEQHKVRFDLTSMSCPFDVAFQPYQPYTNNGVKADLEHHPERREFVDWLRKVVLPIPKDAMRTAIGRNLYIAVPCTVIDLT